MIGGVLRLGELPDPLAMTPGVGPGVGTVRTELVVGGSVDGRKVNAEEVVDASFGGFRVPPPARA
jgi:hypothetical protein